MAFINQQASYHVFLGAFALRYSSKIILKSFMYEKMLFSFCAANLVLVS